MTAVTSVCGYRRVLPARGHRLAQAPFGWPIVARHPSVELMVVAGNAFRRPAADRPVTGNNQADAGEIVVKRGVASADGLLSVAASWGIFWGGWAALIPGIKADLALTNQQLGFALFAIPVGAVPAMLLTGRLTRRLRQHTLPLVTVVFALAVALVGLAPSFPAFAVALLLVGGSSGAIEVALNATTAAYEARDGRRLFNRVHAATPVAMLAAAPAVGLARQVGVPTVAVLVMIALLVAVSAVLVVDRRGWHETAAESAGPRPRRLLGPLVLIGAIGATALLMENAVEQWGAIHLEQQLRVGPLVSSFAPAAYMAGLAVGRMVAQRHGDRFSDRRVLMLGGTLGGVGLAIGAAAWNPWWALVGFGLSGLGIAPVLPTLLSAAGRAAGPDRRSSAISLITIVGYAGFLSSPPLVGVLAGRLGLSAALTLVALGGVVVLTGARFVRLPPAGADRAQVEEATTSGSSRVSERRLDEAGRGQPG
ncbi:MFS transporter [Micromonospora sp. NPDC000212]|uniref:MFS transporter n=1 Tax=Micromonospora sp. NPDC000212 TaxID=3364215 RepID=UPI0036A69A8E